MHKGERLLNLVRGVVFLVFVCAGSFLFCDIFNENADRTKTDPFSQHEKNLKGGLRNKQLKVWYRETKGLTMPRICIVSLLHLLHFDEQEVFPVEESVRNH